MAALAGSLPSFFGLNSLTTVPSGAMTALATCGVHSVPPLAIAAYTRATCSGVTSVSP